MAIAGITIQTTAEAYGTVRERLCASKDVADTQETGVPGMLAAVMETDAAYIEDALDIYVKPYVGQSVIKQALTDQGSEIYSKLLRALGPLTLMLATNELGVMFGDTGITVSNVQGQRSPASDSK